MEVLTSRTIVHPTDLERSLAFYGDALDLPVAREFGAGAGRGVVFFAGGGFIEVVARPGHAGTAPRDAGRPVGTPVALWLQVRSVEAGRGRAGRARGVPLVRPPRSSRGG